MFDVFKITEYDVLGSVSYNTTRINYKRGLNARELIFAFFGEINTGVRGC